MVLYVYFCSKIVLLFSWLVDLQSAIFNNWHKPFQSREPGCCHRGWRVLHSSTHWLNGCQPPTSSLKRLRVNKVSLYYPP